MLFIVISKKYNCIISVKLFIFKALAQYFFILIEH